MKCPVCGEKVESYTSHYICSNCGCEFAIYKEPLHKNLWKSTMEKHDKARGLSK